MPKGAMPALIASVFLSFGIGSTGGVVPEILYARLYHHYDGLPCSNFGHDLAPEACQNGADNAQEASAWGASWSFLVHIGSLFLELSCLHWQPSQRHSQIP
jgi:hypothetical protein